MVTNHHRKLPGLCIRRLVLISYYCTQLYYFLKCYEHHASRLVLGRSLHKLLIDQPPAPVRIQFNTSLVFESTGEYSTGQTSERRPTDTDTCLIKLRTAVLVLRLAPRFGEHRLTFGADGTTNVVEWGGGPC